MLDSWIDEFLLVAKYMNISHAARELHMTQPNLSRHIKQMETELGFHLFVQKGGKLTLTAAGIEFSASIAPLMRSYRSLVQRCATIPEQGMRVLHVQIAPYPDEAGRAYLYFLNNDLNRDGDYEFEFISESRTRQTFEDGVLEQKVDIAVLYLNSPPDHAIPGLAEKGFAARFLATVPLGVWLHIDNPLAHKKELSVNELAKVQVVFPNNPTYPLKDVYIEMMTSQGLTPNCRELHVGSRLEFMMHQSADAACLFPYAMTNDYSLDWQRDRVMIPLSNPVPVCAYAVALASTGILA